MKIVLKLAGLVFFLACMGGAWLGYEFFTFLHTSPATSAQEVFFDVTPGANLSQVATQLQDKGLILNARKFVWLAKWKGWQNNLQAGRFALNTAWLPAKILDVLVNGNPVLFRVTIPEGLTWWQTARLLEQAGLVRFDAFSKLITDQQFLRHYGIPFASAEGFLMPDTYLLKKPEQTDKQTSVESDLQQARKIAGRMVDTFWLKTQKLWPGQVRPAKEDLKKFVILASIVEKETAIGDERPRVAGVYANRLERQMLLQADPTVIYGLGQTFDGNLRRKHLNDAQNLYNTYQHAGLPPGPICSFGLAALRAAINPEKHNYLYFVAQSDGGRHIFSGTLDAHNKAVRQYLKTRKQAKTAN